MRFWHLTSTTYGTWLPGDERGSVSDHFGPDGRHRNNVYGTEFDSSRPDVYREAGLRMKQNAVWLTAAQATAVLDQFEETCHFRGWTLHATSAAGNHFHVALEAGNESPKKLLDDLKAYATRRLNRLFRRQEWWTEGGSKRPKPLFDARFETVRYIRDQPDAIEVRLYEDSHYVQRLPIFERAHPKER